MKVRVSTVGCSEFVRLRAVSLALVVVCLLMTEPRLVNAEEVFPFNACGSAPDLLSLVKALNVQGGDPGSLSKIASSKITINVDANKLQIARDNVQAVSVVRASSDVTKVCRFMPKDAATSANLDEGGGTIPGENVAALAAVLSYRMAHPWPLSVPDIDNNSTGIEIRTSKADFETHPYYFVFIIAEPKPNTIGCGPEESYRVSPQTFEVRPFVGCPDSLSKVLPRLQQLPP
jgi:hypothetical protein